MLHFKDKVQTIIDYRLMEDILRKSKGHNLIKTILQRSFQILNKYWNKKVTKNRSL